MSGDLSDDGILEEMDRVRGDLGGGIDKLGEQMRDMFDWQSYVRAAPLTSVAIAAAAGYLLAPRLRSSPYTLTGEASAASGPGIFGMIRNVLVATATQAASLYIGDLVTRELAAYMPLAPAPAPDGTGAFESTNDLGD